MILNKKSTKKEPVFYNILDMNRLSLIIIY
jgi:hypothetical protein